jgi:hypothetical protein
MATYYWVGGSGTWDASTTTNWALSSGGAGSAGFPTSSDSVIFDLNSGAAPVVTINTAVCSACTIGAPTSGTLTLAFGSSTLTASGNFSVTTTISVTGTGTITCSSTSPTFAGNNNTFYDVSFTSTALGTTIITGANTFNNLSQTSRSATGRRIVQLNENQIVNGTLTLGAANTSIRRIRVQSNVIGTQRTITLNGTLATLADIDFQDINAAGTVATPWTGTRLGNCLGNANITFDAPKNVYRVGTGNWSATQWSLSSGSSVDTNNFPLAQDTAIFDTGTVTGTHTFDQPWSVGTLDCSALNVAVTIATGTSSPVFFKDLILDSDVTLTGTANLQFQGQGTTQTITSAGVSVVQSIIVESPNGTVQLQDNLTMGSTRTFTLTAGTLDLSSGNRTLSAGLFSSSNSNTRSIAFGTGKIELTSNNATIFTTATGTGLSYTGTSRIEASYSGSTGTRTFQPSSTGTSTEAQALSIYITAGTDTVTFTTTNRRVDVLDFTGFSGTFTNSAQTVHGSYTISSGMTVGSGTSVTTFASTSGTKTIATNGKTLDFPLTFNGIGGTFAFQDALTQGSTRAFTITNGTVQLKNGVTSTVGAFTTSGTNQKFLQSTTPGSQATLSQASGTVDASYLTIQDINATGGATWNAFVDQFNVDAGNNDGWDFGISPIVGSYEYTYQLRSFTQPRRF